VGYLPVCSASESFKRIDHASHNGSAFCFDVSWRRKEFIMNMLCMNFGFLKRIGHASHNGLAFCFSCFMEEKGLHILSGQRRRAD
jgi:hypothetical protein